MLVSQRKRTSWKATGMWPPGKWTKVGMNGVRGILGKWVTLLLLGMSCAFAQDDTSMVGTHWVKFEPIQTGGELRGCSLDYLTVQADRAYLNGEWVAVNGAIQVAMARDNRLGVRHRIGLKRVIPNSPYERPHFAFMQTQSQSTAKVPMDEGDTEAGYKLFAYGMEAAVAGVLKDMLESGRVAIGYNRKQDGVEVMVPLDLRVADINYNSDGSVSRKRSPDALAAFAGCYARVAGRTDK